MRPCILHVSAKSDCFYLSTSPSFHLLFAFHTFPSHLRLPPLYHLSSHICTPSSPFPPVLVVPLQLAFCCSDMPLLLLFPLSHLPLFFLPLSLRGEITAPKPDGALATFNQPQPPLLLQMCVIRQTMLVDSWSHAASGAHVCAS